MSRVLVSLAISGAFALVIGLSLLVFQINDDGAGTKETPGLNEEPTLIPGCENNGAGTKETPDLNEEPTLIVPRCENNDKTNLWKIITSPPTFIFGSLPSSNFDDLIEFVSSNAKAAFLSSDEIFFPSTTEQRKRNSGKKSHRKIKGNQIKDLISSDLYGRLVGKIYEFSQDDLHARALLMTMNQITATEFLIFFGKLVEQITKENMTKFDWGKLKKPPTLQLGLEAWALGLNKTVRPLIDSRENVLPARFIDFMLNESLDKLEPEYLDTETDTEALIIQKYKCAEFNATNTIFNFLYRFDASGERLEVAEALNKWWSDDINARNKLFVEKIKPILMSNNGKRKFILVDISHLAGPQGTIIDLLEEEGFEIKRVKASEPLSKVLF